MTLISFGGKIAEKYIPNMKELPLSGEKQQPEAFACWGSA